MSYDKLIIKKHLEGLVDLLNSKCDESFGLVEVGKGNCISSIQYPATREGLFNMNELLKSFGVEAIVDKDDARLMKRKISDNFKIATDSPDFHIEINNNEINVSYSPDKQKVIPAIKAAIEKVQKGMKKEEKIEKLPRPNIKLTPETAPVFRYIVGKLAAEGIPKNAIRISYIEKQGKCDLSFNILIDNNPDYSKRLDSALDKINAVFRTKEKNHHNFRTADKAIREAGDVSDLHITFNITENPGILLAYIKKNDPAGLPKENKPAMAMI